MKASLPVFTVPPFILVKYKGGEGEKRPQRRNIDQKSFHIEISKKKRPVQARCKHRQPLVPIGKEVMTIV